MLKKKVLTSLAIAAAAGLLMSG
ncbi:MAG: hypothetical protein QOD05_186, partial [Microbacteriaceae bacterium]|nr:hypothetical protein [Microbacteriaceae bacterium]